MILILLIASIFGFVLSTILFLKKTTNTKATLLLGSFYIILSIYAFHAYLLDGGYLDQFTWFFLWPLMLFHLIFIPIYYYFQVILTDTLTWHNAQLLLFVPFILGVIDVVVVYALPSHVLAGILQEAILTPENRLNAQYWLLSLNEHLLIRHIWQLGVLIFLLPKILRFIKKRKDDTLKQVLDKWLLVFWIGLVFMAILAILYALEKMIADTGFHSWIVIGQHGGIITLCLYIVLFLIGVIPLYFPSILNGYPQPRISISEVSDDNQEGKNLKFGLDEDEVITKLSHLLVSKSYLNQDFTLTECSRELDMPSHHISYFLKKHYEMSFVAYKNELRMEYAKQLIQEGYLKQNTIEALAHECGFASRTSFSKSFKKHIHVTPSQYVQCVT